MLEVQLISYFKDIFHVKRVTDKSLIVCNQEYLVVSFTKHANEISSILSFIRTIKSKGGR